MSLGDGLVCADQNGLITVWNPGAVAIFGYENAEMIGKPFDRICGSDDGIGRCATFSLLELQLGVPQVSGGTVMEFQARRKSGETFPLEACFSKWQGIDGVQYGAVMRDISDRKREAERIQYLAEHDTLTGLANRNSLYEHLNAKLGRGRCRAGQGRAVGARPRQVQAGQRHPRPCLRRPVAVRRGQAADGAGRERRPGRPFERRRIRHRHQRRQCVGPRRKTWPVARRSHSARFRLSSASGSFASMPASVSPSTRSIARRRTSSSAMPISRSTAPRPPGVASMFCSSAPSATRSRRGCRSKPSCGAPSNEKNWSCSISPRSASKTAGCAARRP